MRGERFFIERRLGRQGYSLVGTQPATGFASVKAAMDWLAARGWITRRLDPVYGEPYWHGWGGESGFYVRAVAPREPVGEPAPVGSLSEFSTRDGAGPLRIPLLPAEPSFWRRALRSAVEECNRKLGRS